MKLGRIVSCFRNCTALPKGKTKEFICHLDTGGGAQREAASGPDYTEGGGGGNCFRVSKRPSLPKPSTSLMDEEGHPGSRGKRRMLGEPENSREYALPSWVGAESEIS